LKDEKDLKPVSLRVRDSAEALLAVIFEQVYTEIIIGYIQQSNLY
jgi:hypothetical protein